MKNKTSFFIKLKKNNFFLKKINQTKKITGNYFLKIK
jgi:hypothetical protein